MKKMKEKRYDMSGLKKSYKKTSNEQFTGDKTTLSKERKTKSAGEPSSSSGVQIKVENVLLSKYKQHLKTLASGKGVH